MSKRNLFYALDDNNESIEIERAKKQNNDYKCPFCKEPVIPKQGEKNIWHFAHKGEPCKEVQNTKVPLTASKNTEKIQAFTKSFSTDIKAESDCKNFLCEACKKIFAKEGGIRIRNEDYLCKECFDKGEIRNFM